MSETATASATTSPAKVSLPRLLAFVAPAAPLMALSLPPIIFLPPYYTDYLGVSEAVVGGLFLAARMLDIFVNPMLGGLQDATKHSFGRRRLWLLAATPVVMFMVWLAFIGLPPGVGAFALGLTVLALYSSFAAMMIAHLGWAGEIRPDYHGRTQILGAVQFSAVIGQVLVLTLPALVQQMGWGDFRDGVHIMGWSIILTLPITVLICVFGVPEPTTPPQRKMGFKEAINAIKENRSLRRVLVPDFLIGVTQGITGTLFIFYMRSVGGFETSATTLLLIYFVAALAGVPLWIVAGKRFGKHRALQIGCLWWAAMMLLIPILPKGDFLIAATGLAIAGIAQSATILLIRAMMADVVDEDQVVTGQQRSGLFFGLLLTTSKVGIATGPVSLIVASAFGFKSALGTGNSETGLLALTLLFSLAPAVILALAALSLQNYPLDENRQRELRELIAAREASR